MEIFQEMARICSEDNNASVQRELLIREGTAKFAETVGENDRHMQKIIQKQVSFHILCYGLLQLSYSMFCFLEYTNLSWHDTLSGHLPHRSNDDPSGQPRHSGRG